MNEFQELLNDTGRPPRTEALSLEVAQVLGQVPEINAVLEDARFRVDDASEVGDRVYWRRCLGVRLLREVGSRLEGRGCRGRSRWERVRVDWRYRSCCRCDVNVGGRPRDDGLDIV